MLRHQQICLRTSINVEGNFKFYPRKPKQTDCKILVLTAAAESMGIDSETYLFGKLGNNYLINSLILSTGAISEDIKNVLSLHIQLNSSLIPIM